MKRSTTSSRLSLRRGAAFLLGAILWAAGNNAQVNLDEDGTVCGAKGQKGEPGTRLDLFFIRIIKNHAKVRIDNNFIAAS